jgi:hypothetical protein
MPEDAVDIGAYRARKWLRQRLPKAHAAALSSRLNGPAAAQADVLWNELLHCVNDVLSARKGLIEQGLGSERPERQQRHLTLVQGGGR